MHSLASHAVAVERDDETDHLRDRLDGELSHEIRPVTLDGLLAYPEQRRDLLVGVAVDHQVEHLAFARCQEREAAGEPGTLDLELTRRPVELDRLVDAIEKQLAAERLLEVVERPRLERVHRRAHVAIARDDDDRQPEVPGGELALQAEAAHPRETELQEEATRPPPAERGEKGLRSRVRLDREPHRRAELAERFARRLVVIHDEDPRHGGGSRGHGALGASFAVLARVRDRDRPVARHRSAMIAARVPDGQL